MTSLIRFSSLFFTAVLRPIQLAAYVASGLVPRRSDTWVFGSWGGHRFADNAAAFFLHCQARIAGSVRLVWISRERDIVARLRARGYEAHWLWSPAGIWRCLRAGLFLFDCFGKDINFWLSRGAKMVNLWSGVPLKMFERDIDNPRNRYYRLFHGSFPERWLYAVMMPWHVDKPDLIIAMSEETAAITARAFALPAEAVAVTGFPRNDALFVETAAGEARPGCPPAVADAARAGKKVFLYLPTFRDSAKPFLDIDWADLDAVMADIDGVFFIKFHPVDATQFENESARVVQLFQDTDVYDVLPHTSALISDYSSIIFDYMLLDRPIVYYTPDLEEFMASSRSFNFDPREIAVGPVCFGHADLAKALADVAAGTTATPGGEAHRAAVMKRLHAFTDGRSNERVLDELRRRIPGWFPRSEPLPAG